MGAHAAEPARRPGERHGFFHIRPVLAVAAHPIVQDQLVRGSAKTDAGHLLAVNRPRPADPVSRPKASFLAEPVDVDRAAVLHLPLPARPSRTIAAQVVLSRVLRNPLRINLWQAPRQAKKHARGRKGYREGNQAAPWREKLTGPGDGFAPDWPAQPATRRIGDGVGGFRDLCASSVACQRNLPRRRRNRANRGQDLAAVSVLDSGGSSSPNVRDGPRVPADGRA